MQSRESNSEPKNLKEILDKYIPLYKIFVGTNDYETNISNIAKITKRMSPPEIIVSVSGGWYCTLIEHNPKQYIFYDVNPTMLINYKFIWDLISISKTREEFITNLFCRKPIQKFVSNADVINFLDLPYDDSIYQNVRKLLTDSSNEYYSTFIHQNVHLAVKEKQIVFPSYIYNKNESLVLGKKLRTTQSGDIYSYFTTFYYDLITPFDNDENYKKLYNNVINITPQFLLFNINQFPSDYKNLRKFTNGKNFVLYIDGIDDEYNYYLKAPRDEIFKEIQSITDCEITVLSTKSGVTTIKPDSIIVYPMEDIIGMTVSTKDIFTKKTLNIYNKPYVYDKYTIDYINKLNISIEKQPLLLTLPTIPPIQSTYSANFPRVESKSQVILDIKPYDLETPTEVIKNKIIGLKKNGLTWCYFKEEEMLYGFRKIMAIAIIDNHQVSGNEFFELLEDDELQLLIQSVDVVAWHKL